MTQPRRRISADPDLVRDLQLVLLRRDGNLNQLRTLIDRGLQLAIQEAQQETPHD